jgi:hypothetical protein
MQTQIPKITDSEYNCSKHYHYELLYKKILRPNKTYSLHTALNKPELEGATEGGFVGTSFKSEVRGEALS